MVTMISNPSSSPDRQSIGNQNSESKLWQRVLDNDTSAFEKIVRRYQAAVSAVCYSCVGDFAASEDISQETFLVAWQAKDKLGSADRLKAWLCGIARNLSKNYQRRSISHRKQAEQLAESLQSDVDNAPTVESRAMQSEEEALVWSTLEEIDATYREPLVLFYREGQSVAAIAEAMAITESTAKQRLSRGRNLLRDSVLKLIGETLSQTAPGAQFTAGVMAAISAGSFAKSAAAASSLASMAGAAVKGSTVAAKAASAMGMAGVAGGLLGGGFGLMGAWLGAWLPTQLAPTMKERELLEKQGKSAMRASLVFIVAFFLAAVLGQFQGGWILAIPVAGLVSVYFITTVIINGIKVQRQVRALRAEGSEDDLPNETPLREWGRNNIPRFVGRRFRSSTSLLGLPLIDVQVGDPINSLHDSAPEPRQPLTAKGWIAVGDRAHGILFALGGRARALIAVGGFCQGVVAIGGVTIGVLSLGGLSLGLLSIGGAAFGMFAFGGLGIGYEAVGGGAIAWHAAAGGAAMGYEGAMGGGAIAKHFAVGGGVIAENANNDAAQTFMDATYAMKVMIFLRDRIWLVLVGSVTMAMVQILATATMYQRKRPSAASTHR